MKNKSSNNCRICYNNHFLVSKNTSPRFEGDVIEGLSLWFEYSFYKKNYGIYEEVLFPEDGRIRPPHVYNCFYDSRYGWKMELNKTKFFMQTNYDKVTFRPIECDVWISGDIYPKTISFEKGVELLKSNSEAFESVNNAPTQTNAHCFIKVPAADET